ncbi:Aldehyde/histidinol dehydrogenase [Gongronella butleri]|nr:Aldehyde/histidinol dehydrogenase [Gongronella butleri]
MVLKHTSFDTLEDSVSVLRGTFLAGTSRELRWRRLNIERIHDMVKENEEKFYDALAKDMGKPRLEAFTGDINPVLEECVYYLDNLDRLVKDKKIKGRNGAAASGTTVVRKEALGLVLILGAWNFPVQLTLVPLIGAIAAGNTVIIKPSEIAPHTANLLADLFPTYVDSRMYRIVNGGVDAATALLAQRFDHIFYTGSTNVGKIVMQAAAKNVTPVTLELGGKSPAIVTQGVNLNTVVQRIAWGKFFNGGQACVAPDYVLLHESLVEPFTQAFKSTVTKWFGANPKLSGHFARMVSERHFDHVARLIAERESGDVVVGGDMDRETRYIAPTLITGVSPLESVLMGDEIFGPVLPVIAYRHLDEALAYISSKEAPLALYIFSKNKQAIERLTTTTQSGGVLINDTMVHQAEYALPFGGVGHSGMGKYHGDKSFETFSHERPIMQKNLRMEVFNSFRYPPYTSRKLSTLRMVLSTHPVVYYYKLRRAGFRFHISFAVLLLLFLRYRRSLM